ncbi:MAG: glycosyltransferase family 4 protein [Candidatus Bathyarchaeia archaeon]
MSDFRILHLISEKPPINSGFARAVGRVSDELEKLGHEVDVLSAEDCYVKLVGDIKLVIGIGKIDEQLRGKYDIVNIHGNTPTFSDRLLVKSTILKKKIVYSYHCPAANYLRPVSYVYNYLFDNLVIRVADAVIVTTKSYYDRLKSLRRKYLIPWGVDTKMFSGRRILHNGYRVLYVGQVRPYKGLKVLLQAMRGGYGELNIVGDGPDRPKLEKYAKKMGMRDVHFYGAVDDSDLRMMYLSNDVVVLPSVCVNEAFGLVTLEAAAAGCAVVASDLPGLRDVVKEFGVLVRPKDIKALRDALLRLKDSSEREKYVRKGFKVLEKYDWRRTAQEYVKVYDDVLSAERRSSEKNSI